MLEGFLLELSVKCIPKRLFAANLLAADSDLDKRFTDNSVHD